MFYDITPGNKHHHVFRGTDDETKDSTFMQVLKMIGYILKWLFIGIGVLIVAGVIDMILFTMEVGSLISRFSNSSNNKPQPPAS